MLRKSLALVVIFISGLVQASTADITKPEQFTFGSSVSEMQDKLKPLCSSVKTRSIIPITAPLAKRIQEQIDCHGFDYGGKKRKIELVFQDDQLDIVWILFPEEEKAFFINAFTTKYGKPSFEIDFGTVYLQANAAVRNTPSEVLFVSDRHMKVMLEMLKTQQNK